MSIKSLIVLLPFLSGLADAAAASTCAKNACFTAVSSNRFAPSAFRQSGCYSFMATTVTPAPATVTKTVGAGQDVVTPGPKCATTAAGGTSVVPSYASACNNKAAYVSACRCFNISPTVRTVKRCTTTVLETTSIPTTAPITITRTTGGVTTTAVTTSFPTAAAPTGCSNQGLNFAVFDNTVTDTQTGYFNFEPSDFTVPLFQGAIPQIYNLFVPDQQDQVAIYSQYVHSSDAFVLNHFGYLFAPESGTYTFTASNVNDVFNFWIGDDAYDGYTRENDDLDTFFFFSTTPTPGQNPSGFAGSATYTVPLVGGLYYPIRYVFGQDTGAATFNFAVTAPDGTQLFGSGSSPYLVRFSCDGVLAPPFPAFAGAAPVPVVGTS